MDIDDVQEPGKNSPMFRRNTLPLSSGYKCWPFYREIEVSRLLRHAVKFILDFTASRTRRRSQIWPACQMEALKMACKNFGNLCSNGTNRCTLKCIYDTQ